MTCLFQSAILVVTSTIIITAVNCTLTMEASERLGGKLTNMLFYKDKLYIAGTDYIHILNKDLTVNTTVNTCDGSETCGNVNKILVLDKKTDQLVICGTGNEGSCKVYNVTTMAKTDTILKVSTDTERPALGMITEYGNLMVAVTYGDGEIDKSDSDGHTYNYAISTRKLPVLPLVKSATGSKVLKLSIHMDSLSDYLIYYKSAFQYKGYSYFITNQKKKVGLDEYVSKLVRICQNDNGYYSYVDIPLECENKGKYYNLVQSAIITELPYNKSERLLVAAFTYGEEPENPTGDTVFCQIRLTKLHALMIDGIKKYALTCEDPSQKKTERYLESHKRNNICFAGEKEFQESLSNLLCNTYAQLYSNVIIERTASMTQTYTLESGNGSVTALGKSKLDNGAIVVLAGTSSGKLIRMNLDDDDDSLEEYDRIDVGQSSIRALLQVDNETLYVMTEKNVYKYSSTNCSEFHTCAETMAGRNPLCGWCVFEGRATRKLDCSDNHWLQSFNECIQLKLTPKGVQVSGETVEVTINATSIPAISDDYKCLFKHGSEVIKETIAEVKDNKFKCQTPAVSKHTIAVLEFIVASSNVSIAEAQFLFFDCRTYHKCGECVSTIGANCTWNINKPGCNSFNPDGITQNQDCPKLEDNAGINYIPRNTSASVKLLGSNLPNSSSTDLNFWCYVKGVGKGYNASILNNEISCDIEIASEKIAKKEVRVHVKYGTTEANSKELDDHYMNHVTVYDCGLFAHDCSHCKALNTTRYKCHWCGNKCQHKNSCTEECPTANITEIFPTDGPVQGGTKVTISGTELGSDYDDVKEIKVAEVNCIKSNNTEDYGVSESEDFAKKVPKWIVCTTGKKGKERGTGSVEMEVNSKQSTGSVEFSYEVPVVTSINPVSGLKSGGTTITIFGEYLGIGNRKDFNVTIDSIKCSNGRLNPYFPVTEKRNVNYTILCEIGQSNFTRIYKVLNLLMNDALVVTERSIEYRFLTDPTITMIQPKKATLSGGTGITVVGANFTHAQKVRLEGTYGGQRLTSTCVMQSSEKVVCYAPEASTNLKKEMSVLLENNENSNRRKRSACDGCIEVKITIYLDGYKEPFTVTYFRDPLLDSFGNGGVRLFGADDQELKINGKYLNYVAKESDVNITIGVEKCTILQLKEKSLTCIAPPKQPDSGNPNLHNPEVNVTIGNFHVRVGFLEYEKKLELFMIIAGAVGGFILFLAVVTGVACKIKYGKIRSKAREYEKNLSDMEMEIKRVAREEFLDMHTTMSSVNKNLVEQGFPYHSYQQFACNVMFSVDYLWTEPVMTDDERLKANKGMETLESLISNKFFLVSVITTMENEKRFFIREKSNLAGNLCAVLMGRMDYLNEILKLLMTNLVQESSAKKHKTLFRRCESITEKLLSNWLSLCLYPHVKSHSGSPLYLLYMATQKTMESGPIDAVTCDAKYTLSEEKLLKKWSSSVEEDGDHDLKFEAKTLTLNVVVDNGEEIFKCKALDCDTISQVKTKCLNQIYVNYPASQLPVGGDELALEWHEGFGGALKLRDEDNTSKHDGHWVRLNTLAHYNVKDESNMALIDPHSAENNMEDYVNLANINMDGVCDGSIDSSQPLTPHDEENPHDLDYWHLVKKEEESSKQGKSAIAELYLNRLFTTKQSLMEYMRPLFDLILDHDRCPPPTKFLYDFLDELGEKNRVETDTVHAWKSHSYAIRVWASLMKMPNTLFDVKIPPYMDENLSIISQVFIESFSLASQKFTKDSPSQKLIFHHEMNHYRERVKEFYKNVKVDSQNSDEYRQYLAEVNRLQQQTNFNKISALYRFYKQLKPYFEDILENLAKSKEASTLHLDRKLEQVIAIMEEED